MLFATWATIRWTQVISNQWIWARGIFRVARDEGQSLIININGLQKAPLANEMRAPATYIDYNFCNETSPTVFKTVLKTVEKQCN